MSDIEQKHEQASSAATHITEHPGTTTRTDAQRSYNLFVALIRHEDDPFLEGLGLVYSASPPNLYVTLVAVCKLLLCISVFLHTLVAPLLAIALRLVASFLQPQ